MLCKAGEPLLTSDNVSSAHKMIVDRVGKVVGGDSVRLEKNEVLIVFGNFKVALYKIGEFSLLLGVAECKNSENEGVILLKMES